MTNIQNIFNNYKHSLDYFDLELIIADSLGKTREFVLTYPNQTITKAQETKIKKNVSRRVKGEPIAYILGHKEFYGLDFIVNEHTLVPRPETELLVELVTQNVERETQGVTFVDVGTGSGNIIISIANELEKNKTKECPSELGSESQNNTTSNISTKIPDQVRNDRINYLAIDISKEALKIAKKNAKLNGVDKKIKFLHGSLIDPILNETKKLMPEKLIITANLPYLSKEIYNSAPIDVKKFEPKSALYSPEDGLQHYRKLLQQIRTLTESCGLQAVSCFLEISPEQKIPLTKTIKQILPKATIEFKKDLAGKWRMCVVKI